MTKLLLPATINPPRLRKDGSASVSFDTRELNAEEIFTIMGFRHTEGWLVFSPNENELDVPEEKAELDEKSASQRLRNVIFVWFKQEVDSGNFIGLFETFRKEKMEQIIESIKKNKLND